MISHQGTFLSTYSRHKNLRAYLSGDGGPLSLGFSTAAGFLLIRPVIWGIFNMHRDVRFWLPPIWRCGVILTITHIRLQRTALVH
jgi:hypothetical protein